MLLLDRKLILKIAIPQKKNMLPFYLFFYHTLDKWRL